MLILQGDKEYCSDCYYVVAVRTHEGKANYGVLVKAIQAERSQQVNLLRVGVPQNVRLSSGQENTTQQI